MNDLTFKEAMQQFGLDDFRRFNRIDFINLATAYRKLDPEVAKALIAQIPQYMKTITDSVGTIKEMASETIKVNSDNLNHLINIYEKRIDVLNLKYNDDSITDDERYKITCEISEHLEKITNLIDKESDRNHNTLITISGMIMTGIMLVGTIFGLKNKPNGSLPKHTDINQS